MGKKGNAPTPPDAKTTADASTSTNISTAIANSFLNNVNRYTPDGSLTTKQTGAYTYSDPFTGKTYQIPTFTQTTKLSPTQQAIKNQQDAASLKLSGVANTQINRVNSLLSQPFNLNGLPSGGDANDIRTANYSKYAGGPNLQTSYGGNFSADRQKVEDALMARLNPQLERDRTALETSLANKGIKLGSASYDRGIDELNRKQNDARLGAILGAGDEQTRLANLARDQAQFGNTAKQQMADNAFRTTEANNSVIDRRINSDLARFNAQNTQRQMATTERFATRNQPLNEIAALLSGAQLQTPQFQTSSMSSIPTTDIASLLNSNYNQQFANYQNQQQQQQSLLGGLFGLGGSLFALSDDDAKKDKERLNEVAPGMHMWAFRYKGESAGAPRRIGLMASEVEKKVPDAVTRRSDGYRQVNYSKALGSVLGYREAA